MPMTNTPTLKEHELLFDAERAMPAAYRQIMQALRVLDGQCDGARTPDGLGFSRLYARQGHDFATLYSARSSHLTAAQLRFAFNICSVFTRQLADAGLLLPTTQEVTAVEQFLRAADEERRRLRAIEDAALLAAAEAPLPACVRAADSPTRIELSDRGTLRIIFPYNKTLVGKMHALQVEQEKLARRVKGLSRVRFWQEGGVHWEAPIEMLASVVAALPGFARTPDVAARIAALEEEAARAEALLAVRADAERERVTRLARALGKLIEPLKNGRVLYKHQREGIITLARWGAGILGDDMGLGKTTEAAVLAKAYHDAYGARVIIVGPRTLRIPWLREAAEIGLTNIEYYTYEKMPCIEDMRGGIDGDTPYVLFIDEAQAFQSLTAQRTKKAIPLAHGALTCVPISGTPIKNGRPINIYPLLLMVKHPLVYAALPDGAPDEEEIRRLRADYLRRYCASDQPPVVVNGKPIFDANGARALDELNRMIVGTARGVIRRRKDQCLDLPKKIRKFVQLELDRAAEAAYYSDLDAMWDAYERRLNARIEKYQADEWEADTQKRVAAHIEAEGAPDTEQAYGELIEEIRAETLEIAVARMQSGEALVNLNNLRQCGSRAKLAPTLAMMADIVEQDAVDAAEATLEHRAHKPAAFVVFSAFVATANAVAEAAASMGLRAGLITGEQKDAERQAAIDEFQSGARRVVSCVYGAGGVGVTLTRATHVILLDRPWTPGDAEQAEDRGHRIGLEEDLLALWMQIPESVSDIDQKIDGILLTKQERVLKTLDGDLDNLPPDILFKNIAGALVKDVMAARRARAKKSAKNDD